MASKRIREIRQKADDAHVEFIRHDIYCKQCSESYRHGAQWQTHLCADGRRLWDRLDAAHREAIATY